MYYFIFKSLVNRDIPIPEGVYRLVVRNCKIGYDKDAGNNMSKCLFCFMNLQSQKDSAWL